MSRVRPSKEERRRDLPGQLRLPFLADEDGRDEDCAENSGKEQDTEAITVMADELEV
jgi:hypothetical protein